VTIQFAPTAAQTYSGTLTVNGDQTSGTNTIAISGTGIAPVTITFNGLTANGAAVTSYTESGFTVLTSSSDWVVSTTYGNPAPFIQFRAPAGTTVTRDVQVTAGGSAFSFMSVDLYSSTTPIPYTITGLRNSTTVFTLADMVPNTFGNFRTVANPRGTDAIDTLRISISNPAAPCCTNPMGLDNVVLTK
jgi:hypothetical protein